MKVAETPSQIITHDWLILERYYDEDDFYEEGVVYVQATRETKATLHRAGFKRTRTFNDYPVKVQRDWMGRLLIVPES